jgi:hypothetical protein
VKKTRQNQNPKPGSDSIRTDPALVCIDPERVKAIWPHAASLLQAACRRTGLNAFADLEADILSGRTLLWIAWSGDAIEAAAATVLINSETGKVCIITACGGRGLERWLPLIGGIETYARNEGCARVRVYGRRGWQRVLAGFEQKHVIIDKELD